MKQNKWHNQINAIQPEIIKNQKQDKAIDDVAKAAIDQTPDATTEEKRQPKRR